MSGASNPHHQVSASRKDSGTPSDRDTELRGLPSRPRRLPHPLHSKSEHVQSRTDLIPDIASQDMSGSESQMLRSRSLHSPSMNESMVHHSRSVSSQEISILHARSTNSSTAGVTRLRKDPSFRSTRAPSHRVGISRSLSTSGPIPIPIPIVPPSGKIEEPSLHDTQQPRVVYVNEPGRTNENYDIADNRVRTSKYTWYSFLPRNLFEQFHRVAYVYFLTIAVLNQIPQLAVFGRAVSAIPLAVVLVVTAVKDGYEDWARHTSDTVENNRAANIFQETGYLPKRWKKVEVGELLKIHANETVPCDIVLLGTSDPSGVAYVQTTNLDGESNLKTRYAHQETLLRHPELGSVNGVLKCEQPNRNIYEFSGYLDLDTEDPAGIRLPLGPNNIILRGCELKNTEWVVGVVVYAGKETKAMLNSSGAQSKRSKLEHQMNRETIWLSVFLCVLCLVGGIGTGIWIRVHEDQLDRLTYYKRKELNGDDDYMFYGIVGEAVIAFLSCVISFQIMIPLSLYISMELVRLGQTYFMVRDGGMFHEETQSRLQCRALNINEDLGQIKYVFSDKTGTLTENMMEFHTASINGRRFARGGGDHGSGKGKGSRTNQELVSMLQTSEDEALREFLLVLAACNTVVPTWINQSASGLLEMEAASAELQPSGYLEYQGESPDEQALVSAASWYDFTLAERTASSIVINILGASQRYEILGIHEFDSVRKRMSVVVEAPDKSIKVLVKGADSQMMSVVRNTSDVEDVRQLTFQHLKEFAQGGLRTLVVASKTLGRSEYERWRTTYSEASTALTDRAEKLQAAAASVESGLTLLGATGIEDKLQDGVPETIASLREAGIRVWVLTGDKQETAISIGFSSALLTHDMQQIIINESTREGCRMALAAAKSILGSVSEKRKASLNTQVSTEQNRHLLALVIDGTSLVHALADELSQELFEVAIACQAVLCCRVAPYQKAAIVSLIKKKDKAMTLSIGDGANDVAMIQMADIGVGISGQEGRQAVMASDFAMPQFRYLNRLLLVHGHWNYQRLAYMVLYNFYRNALFVLLLFWYILYTTFSSQTAIFDWNLTFYSLFYTSVPTIVVAMFDKDVNQRTLVQHPQLYGSGLRHESYNRGLFWLTMVDTLWQSLVLFYVPFFTYKESTVDIWSLGSLWTIAVVILVNVHLAMDVQTWNWILHLAIWGSIVVTYACLFILDAIKVENFLGHYWVTQVMVTDEQYWLDLVIIVCLALLPRFMVTVVRQRWWPSDVQIAREAEVLAEKSPARTAPEVEMKTRGE